MFNHVFIEFRVHLHGFCGAFQGPSAGTSSTSMKAIKSFDQESVSAQKAESGPIRFNSVSCQGVDFIRTKKN